MERITRNPPTTLLALVLATAVAMTLVLISGMTFLGDTWEFLMGRREITADTLFKPHNEHIVVIPVLIEQLFLRLFGMSSATPEHVLLAVFLAATAALLYVYVKRRVGPWLALLAAIVLLCLGPAWEVLLWPFEITFIGPILFGLAMLLALEREDRRGDIAACVFLTLALGFSGLGIPFIAAAVVAVLLGPRQTWLRRAYIFVIPAALYAVWYLGWGHDAETHISLRNVLASPRYVAEGMAAATGAVFGLGTNPTGGSTDPVWGRAILVALVVVLGYRQLRKPGFFPGLWPAAAAAGAYWLLTAFNQIPGRDPMSSRYQYAGAVFILLILANLFKGVQPTKRFVIGAAAVTAVAVASNLVILKDGSDYFERQSVLTRADTAAIEIAARTVDPNFQLNPEVAGTPSLLDIFAGSYLTAIDEYGSPAYSVAELESAPEEGRWQADVVLANALPLSTVTQLGAYSADGGENCVFLPPGEGGPAEIPLSPGPTRIEVAPGTDAALSLRRFAQSEYPVNAAAAPGGSTTILRIPADRAPARPWYLRVEMEQAGRVCR